MAGLDRETVRRARDDVGAFAKFLVGEPLWSHQLELALSTARVRSACSGRQAGKTRTLAVVSLYDAFVGPGRRVLIVSAGEEASKDLLREVATLASAPLLAGSVVDDERHQLSLTNGSTIRSVPASERQIRGKSVDLLVVDEAAFVDDGVWTAARFTTLARPGSRVILASTPWGRRDRFFSVAYRAGLRNEAGYASFHWPSTASPLVDAELLDIWRRTTSDREYRREVLAEWVDAQGQYFGDDELAAAVADYLPLDPGIARRRAAVGGVDWGFARDSSGLVLLAEAAEGELDGEWPERTFVLPYIEEAIGVPYARFVRRVAEVAQFSRITRLATETNGVGAMPSQELRRLAGDHIGRLVEVSTTAESKAEGFGRVKVLLSQGRLALPRHPRLLGQLAALEFEERESGSVRIAVPERAGHDDLAMALCLAAGVGSVASGATEELRLMVPRGRIPTHQIRSHDIGQSRPPDGWRPGRLLPGGGLTPPGYSRPRAM